MKIAEYLAPTERLTPSNEGFSAFETAGRRIGPLYNQQAQDVKEEGRLKAQEIEDLARWPFDILNLRNQVAEAQAAKAAKEGIRIGSVTEGYNAVEGNAGKAGRGGIIDQPFQQNYSTFQQISQGGAVMGATARSLIAPQSLGQPVASTFDPNAVTTGPAYTLQNGQFVKVNNQDPNAGYAKANQQASDLANQANEWYGQGQDAASSQGWNSVNPMPANNSISPLSGLGGNNTVIEEGQTKPTPTWDPYTGQLVGADNSTPQSGFDQAAQAAGVPNYSQVTQGENP